MRKDLKCQIETGEEMQRVAKAESWYHLQRQKYKGAVSIPELRPPKKARTPMGLSGRNQSTVSA